MSFYPPYERGDMKVEVCWSAVRRWMIAVREGVDRGEYHAARGFVMYLVAGRKPR